MDSQLRKKVYILLFDKEIRPFDLRCTKVEFNIIFLNSKDIVKRFTFSILKINRSCFINLDGN